MAKYHAGGIYLENSSALIRNANVLNNKAIKYGGGGIYAIQYSQAIFATCVIQNNSARPYSEYGHGDGNIFFDTVSQLYLLEFRHRLKHGCRQFKIK